MVSGGMATSKGGYSRWVRRAVFLDRDGTIIDNLGDLGEPDGVALLAGAAGAIIDLADEGWTLVVVTNQAGVARGAFTEEDIAAVNARIEACIEQEAGKCPIDRWYHCPYHPDGPIAEWTADHDWRKPQPGMLLAASEDLGIDLGASWMIGDQDRDIEAGIAAGCRTIWLTAADRTNDRVEPTAFAPSLVEASQLVLAAAEAGV